MHRKIRAYITKNWGLKLVSFLLAFVLWLTLIPEEKKSTERRLTVNLEIHNIPPQMRLMERPPQTVDVTIRAPNRLLPQISNVNVHVALDLASATVAQTQYVLSNSMVSVPSGAEVKEIFPSQVNLKLEMTREIVAEVEVDLIGELQESVARITAECTPSRVMIRGPESKIKDGMKVKTTPVDQSLFTKSGEIRADLILPDSALSLVDPGIKVTVRLVVETKENEKGPDSPEAKEKAASKKKPPNKKYP